MKDIDNLDFPCPRCGSKMGKWKIFWFEKIFGCRPYYCYKCKLIADIFDDKKVYTSAPFKFIAFLVFVLFFLGYVVPLLIKI